MNRRIHADGVPPALGPYSHAVATPDLVFTAGQIGMDPVTGSLIEGGIAAETRQALANLLRVLEAAGTGLDRVVKSTVFLTDLDEFQEFNTTYASVMGPCRPARSTVQVSRLPAGARVEIEFVATRH